MDALACLTLHIEFGAHDAVQSTPRNRLRDLTPPPAIQPAAAQPPPTLKPPTTAPSLAALEASLATLPDCALITTATHMVFGAGPAGGAMLLADTPAEAEDMSGQPFAAEAGWLLDRMLDSIDLSRAQVRLAYAIPWRPPGSRPPTERERAQLRPFLLQHVALTRPRAVLCFGLSAAAMLLAGHSNAALRKMRGTWQALTLPGLDAPIPVLPTLSLEQVIKKPAEKAEIWADMIRLRQILSESSP